MSDSPDRAASRPLSAEEEAEIRRRERSATPGPWRVSHRVDTDPKNYYKAGAAIDSVETDIVTSGSSDNNGDPYGVERNEDAEFIAAARQDIPRLLATLDREREEVEDLVQSNEKLHGVLGDYLKRMRELRAENERLAAQVGSMRAVVEAALNWTNGYDARQVLHRALEEYKRSQVEPQEPTEYPKEEHDGD